MGQPEPFRLIKRCFSKDTEIGAAMDASGVQDAFECRVGCVSNVMDMEAFSQSMALYILARWNTAAQYSTVTTVALRLKI